MIKELVISPDGDSPENGVPINLVSKCTRCLVRSEKRNVYIVLQPAEIRLILASKC